ncbi:MAG TPA: ATP-binding protein [Burkholderiaceae bacterium]|nr:ATP-binding protein [Burkholderiaceae bacterium]
MTPHTPAPSQPGLPPPVSTLANREGLARCLNLAETVCQQLGLSDDDMQAVRLSVEEACVNVVSHGYKDREPGLLGLAFHVVNPHTLQAHIQDQAAPFHPDQAPIPDLLADVDDRPIGGLGWMLIRQMMPPVDYISNANGNTLVLERHLQQPLASPLHSTPRP